MLERLANQGKVVGLAGLRQTAPVSEVGFQPVEGLLTQAGLFLVALASGVVALAAAGQRGTAGGVVTVCRLPVVGQLGVSGEGICPEASGGGVALQERLIAEIGEGQHFLGALGPVLAVEHGG